MDRRARRGQRHDRVGRGRAAGDRRAASAAMGGLGDDRTRGARLAVVLLSGAQLQVLLLLGTPLSYVAASANLPLQDATLAAFDRSLGLDWCAYYDFVMQRPSLIPYAYLGYAMI